MTANPHLEIEPVVAGVAPERCRVAAVLVHGRDQDEGVMLDVVARLGLGDVAYLLPVAAGRSWYDGRYFDPVTTLRPQLDEALRAVQAGIERLWQAGVGPERIVVAGFSQGACLVAELAARGPAPWMGVGILTGSLIGPRSEWTTPVIASGLPIYVSAARDDAWLDLADVQATADAFAAAGASVRFEPLDDREHLISDPAVAGLKRLLTSSVRLHDA